MKDLSIENEEAVMIACRRYAVKIAKKDHEKDMLKILGDCRLEVRDEGLHRHGEERLDRAASVRERLQRLINEKAIMQVIQGAQAITIIADEAQERGRERGGQGERAAGASQPGRDIGQFAREIMETSGVFSYLASNLSENNVNVAESVSCYTDTIFIVDEKDMIHAYEILSKMIASAELAKGIEE